MSNVREAKSYLIPSSAETHPVELPRPHWLIGGDFHSDTWVIIDGTPSSPGSKKVIRWNVQLFDPRRPGEICRLTDPDYINLLDTVKRQAWGLRTGRYASVLDAKTHEEMCRAIINWVIWMIQNSIYQFSSLDEEDFDAYLESAPFGPGHLLTYAPRLVQHIERMKSTDGGIPSIKRVNTRPYLDAFRLMEEAGIDPYKGRVDTAVACELLKIADVEGFYLSPLQRKNLQKAAPIPKRQREVRVLITLQPWDYQWRMRQILPGDRIQFNPFQEVSCGNMAKQLGEKQGRTKTAPVPQTMELIDKSIRWVLNYAPAILNLRDEYLRLQTQEFTKDQRYHRFAKIIGKTHIPHEPGSPIPLNASTKTTVVEGVDFGVAANVFVPVSCAVVISAFSARRQKEVTSLRAAGPDNEHCISKTAEGLWLETYIEKTHRAWLKTPCNELVAAAVEVLDRWSAPAREVTGKVGIFQTKRLTADGVASFDLVSGLNEFVEFLQITPLKDGGRWKFSPHQFRRFFAILYFWRYEYGNLAALSHHLKHFSPAMTQVYVTEPETGAIFREVNKEHTVSLLTETAMGERNLTGPFGEKFKKTVAKLYDRFSRFTKVVSPDLVSKMVERYVDRSGRRLKAMPWGYCSSGTLPHQLNKARCLRNSPRKDFGGPDFSGSSPSVCSECQHHLTDLNFEPFLRTQLEFHERAANDPKNGSLLQAASREHAEKLRLHCQRSFENSTPLEVENG